jgi:hypothetical protein
VTLRCCWPSWSRRVLAASKGEEEVVGWSSFVGFEVEVVGGGAEREWPVGCGRRQKVCS